MNEEVHHQHITLTPVSRDQNSSPQVAPQVPQTMRLPLNCKFFEVRILKLEFGHNLVYFFQLK